MRETRVRVLYIGSHNRSGSTMLDRMLGQLGGFCSVGEMRLLWQSFADDRLCGCGKSFKDCEFWRAVLKEGFGSLEKLNIHRIIALKNAVEPRMRYIPWLMISRQTVHYRNCLDAYSQILSTLYKAVQMVSGSAIIVDSSKHPWYGFMRHAIPDIDLYTVHLVRDSRGVAFSQTRKKRKPEVIKRVEYLDQSSPVKSALSWNLHAVLYTWLRHQGTPYLLMRYEDLVERPQDELPRIIRFAGLDEHPKMDFIQGHRVHLRETHTVAGNPMRFEQGWVELRLDDEWRARMSAAQRLVVTTLTFPGLLRYRYLWTNRR